MAGAAHSRSVLARLQRRAVKETGWPVLQEMKSREIAGRCAKWRRHRCSGGTLTKRLPHYAVVAAGVRQIMERCVLRIIWRGRKYANHDAFGHHWLLAGWRQCYDHSPRCWYADERGRI